MSVSDRILPTGVAQATGHANKLGDTKNEEANAPCGFIWNCGSLLPVLKALDFLLTKADYVESSLTSSVNTNCFDFLHMWLFFWVTVEQQAASGLCSSQAMQDTEYS